ncbi:MAG: DegV family protein [Chloroflexi bacterium]|nr:DegV family protein [Chloroflexota bacterium]
MIRIVTDSLSDIPANFVERYQITVIPAEVIFGTQSFRDGIDLSNAEFYQRLATSKELPHTSQPSVGAFEEAYRRLAPTCDGIISIHLPAKVSGTVRSAQMAAMSFPHTKIEIIDSGQASMALGWLVIACAQLAQEGGSMQDILSLIEDMRPRLRLVAMLDTLEYIRRGGRIGRAQAMLGAILSVKPIVELRDGEVLPVENVRTKTKAVSRLVEIVLAQGPLERVAVAHANAIELAEELRQRLSPHVPGGDIPIAEAGPALGTHAGPGAIGVTFVVK